MPLSHYTVAALSLCLVGCHLITSPCAVDGSDAECKGSHDAGLVDASADAGLVDAGTDAGLVDAGTDAGFEPEDGGTAETGSDAGLRPGIIPEEPFNGDCARPQDNGGYGDLASIEFPPRDVPNDTVLRTLDVAEFRIVEWPNDYMWGFSHDGKYSDGWSGRIGLAVRKPRWAAARVGQKLQFQRWANYAACNNPRGEPLYVVVSELKEADLDRPEFADAIVSLDANGAATVPSGSVFGFNVTWEPANCPPPAGAERDLGARIVLSHPDGTTIRADVRETGSVMWRGEKYELHVRLARQPVDGHCGEAEFLFTRAAFYLAGPPTD